MPGRFPTHYIIRSPRRPVRFSPCSPSGELLSDFHTGGRFTDENSVYDLSAWEHVCVHISQFFEKRPQAMCVIEDHLRTPAEYSKSRARWIVVEAKVQQILLPGDTEDYIESVLLNAGIDHFYVGAAVDGAGEGFAALHETHEPLNEVVKHAAFVFLEAYDNEGFVFWVASSFVQEFLAASPAA
jgi:hypothetical protein